MHYRLLGWFLVIQLTAWAQSALTGLRTDLLLHTDRVWSNGFLTNLNLDAADSANFAGQRALIRSSRPSFSWVISNGATTRRQTAFRLLLSSS